MGRRRVYPLLPPLLDVILFDLWPAAGVSSSHSCGPQPRDPALSFYFRCGCPFSAVVRAPHPLHLYPIPRRLLLEACRGAVSAPLGDAGDAPTGRLSFPIAQSDPSGAYYEQRPPWKDTQRDGAFHVISSTKTFLHLASSTVLLVSVEAL